MAKSEDTEDTHSYSWWIPLTFVDQESLDFDDTQVDKWLKDEEITLQGFSSKWFIFNVQQTGYYRVNYDVENWEALAKQLQEDLSVIATLNRAQIVDDSLNLARAGN